MIVDAECCGSEEVSKHVELKSQINFNIATALLKFIVFV